VGRVIVLILMVGGSLFLGGWLREQGAPVEVNSFALGAGIFGSIGFLVFRFQVWAEGAGEFFKPQTVVLKTDKSPAQVLGNTLKSYAMVADVVIVAVMVAIWYSGHGDMNWQILSWLAQKSVKLINALLH
jgi:hypothetical protein